MKLAARATVASTLVAFFYPRSGVLRVGGTEVQLDSANVLLLDYVDGGASAPTLRAAGCVAVTPIQSAIDRAIASLPAVRTFIE